jgi:glyoxylase-like metal-dependent hydrolase (beta-lactamase superfamily II)
MKITSNIYQVGGSRESHPSDASVFLIKDGSHCALIDTGTGQGHSNIIKNIETIETDIKNIKEIFITHCHYDHTGGINALREDTSARVIAHKKAAQYIEEGNSMVTAADWYGAIIKPTKVDIIVHEEEKVFKLDNLSINFHFTPGHSPGSSVYTMISDEKKILFGQDIHGPLNDTLLSSRPDYIQSLEYLLTIEADILCEGHFGVYYGKEEIRDFIQSYL